MSSLILIPRDDPKQAVRMRRFFMAAGTSVLVIGVLLAWHLLGMLKRGPFVLISVLIVFWILAFYGLFRTGSNRKWADASLTLPQMAASSLTLLGAMYAADRGRAVFLLLLLMVFMFGVLRLRTRALLVYTACIVSGYAGVIGLSWLFKREALDLQLELLQLLILGVTMPWFALMGGYISALREQLKTALRTVRDREQTLAQAQRLAGIGSWTYNPVTRVAVWSAEAYRIFGVDPNEAPLVGAALRSIVHAEDKKRYIQVVEKSARDGKDFDSEFRIVLPSGVIRWVHAIGQPTVDDKGLMTLLRGTVMDITERKASEEQIRQLAHFDAQTRLPNRNLLMQLLHHALAKTQRLGTPLAVLFIDLDGFKNVNDTLGHEAGDFLLAAFAQRLGNCLRKSDTAARLGGDEFIVVLDDFDGPSAVRAIAERVLLAASTPFQVESHECIVSASLGVAMYPQAGADVDTLIKNADKAMYFAKQAGRNNYRFWGEPTDARSQT